MTTTKAYGVTSATSPVAPLTVDRREVGPGDIRLEVLFCGVCHSDLHTARNEWHNTVYPCVPGHEIVGRVTQVGAAVKNFRVGQLAAVGCMVDSCRTCASCRDGEEQFCETGATFTYNSPEKVIGGTTFGGYSESLVTDAAFALHLPENLDPAAAAPLLCAGITTWSPLRRWKVGPGQKVGIIGLGGLGHMGVKFAKALGARVVLFTTSPGKIADGKRLGADEVVVSKNPAEMAAHLNSFDFILDCVSAQHDLNAYLALLKRGGVMALVGVPEHALPVAAFSLIGGRRQLVGSLIGGIAETREMLEFCGQHGIVSDIELIPVTAINEAYERMLKSDVKYRFVLDIASLKNS